MKQILTAAKGMSRGVFWVIDGNLLAFPFREDSVEGIAKSGNTYNHKKLWDNVKSKDCHQPYNYYPRGRVDSTNKGQAVVYLNPNIDESILPKIIKEFAIQGTPKIRYDYSAHYRCYLDGGWKPDNQ